MKRPALAVMALLLACVTAGASALPALASPAPATHILTFRPAGTAAAVAAATQLTLRARALAAAKAAAGYTAKSPTASKRRSEAAKLGSILRSLKRKYRLLGGVTARLGRTPGGYQAVAYYKVGRIVVSKRHRASLSRIMKHEIWHIIDWRDNHRIDWREHVPPRNASKYLK